MKIPIDTIPENNNADWWNEISDAERVSIYKGLRELEEGKGIPHEQVVKMYAKWFVK